VSQLIFASMASESVVEPSTPSTRRYPHFSPSESGRVATSAPRPWFGPNSDTTSEGYTRPLISSRVDTVDHVHEARIQFEHRLRLVVHIEALQRRVGAVPALESLPLVL
jgi:hypothetical protein